LEVVGGDEWEKKEPSEIRGGYLGFSSAHRQTLWDVGKLQRECTVEETSSGFYIINFHLPTIMLIYQLYCKFTNYNVTEHLTH
jgi:hypothetical protein